jgi:hypothetical protein
MQALFFIWIWYLKYQFNVNPDFVTAEHLVDNGERPLITIGRRFRPAERRLETTEEADGAPLFAKRFLMSPLLSNQLPSDISDDKMSNIG